MPKPTRPGRPHIAVFDRLGNKRIFKKISDVADFTDTTIKEIQACLAYRGTCGNGFTYEYTNPARMGRVDSVLVAVDPELKAALIADFRRHGKGKWYAYAWLSSIVQRVLEHKYGRCFIRKEHDERDALDEYADIGKGKKSPI